VVTRTDYNQIGVIYYCLKQYEDRLDDLVDEFRPHLENGLIQEGLHKLAKNFETEEHTGPKFRAPDLA